MAKSKNCGIRANYIAAIFLNTRPDYEDWEEFCRREKVPLTATVDNLIHRKDVKVGFLYHIARIFGYQIIVYNPNPPKGLEKMYLVGKDSASVMKKEPRAKHTLMRDDYTGEIYRVVNKYKRKRKYEKVIRKAN